MRASSARWATSVCGHRVEVVDQPAELVGRVGDDAHVEAPGGDQARGPRQPRDRIGDAAGDRGAEAGGEQHDHDRADEHAAVELVDLALDLALARRERHAAGLASRVPAARRHRRGRDQILERADAILADRRSGRRLERDRAVHAAPACASAAGRSRTDRAGSSRRARPLVEVHVLIDDLPDPDHHVVGERDALIGGLRLGGRQLLEHALRARATTFAASASTSARNLPVM